MAQESFVCTLKWPRLIAEKQKKNLRFTKKKFGRIDSCSPKFLLSTPWPKNFLSPSRWRSWVGVRNECVEPFKSIVCLSWATPLSLSPFDPFYEVERGRVARYRKIKRPNLVISSFKKAKFSNVIKGQIFKENFPIYINLFLENHEMLYVL